MPYADKEVAKQRNRRYYEAHREKMLFDQKQYREAHIEHYKLYMKQYYKDHTEKAKQERKERGKEFRMWKAFAGPCRCGMDDGRVLDFHHLNPEVKKFDIDSHKWYSVPLINLIEELKKCIVLCVNCHRIEEFENGVWK